MDSGVARKPLVDLQRYARDLATRLDADRRRAGGDHRERARQNPRRVVFAEGEEEKVIRAAIAFRNAGYGTPVLVGREDRIARDRRRASASRCRTGIEIHNARLSDSNRRYAEFLYAKRAARRLPAARLPAPGEPGPQRLRRLHGGDRAMRMRW